MPVGILLRALHVKRKCLLSDASDDINGCMDIQMSWLSLDPQRTSRPEGTVQWAGC